MPKYRYETTITLPIVITVETDDDATDPDELTDRLGRARTECPGYMESASRIIIQCPRGTRASVAILEASDLDYDVPLLIAD